MDQRGKNVVPFSTAIHGEETMLVLGRKKGQRIVIGTGSGAVIVTVADGRRVRLGIEAPQNVPIRREELATDRKQPDGP